MCEPGRLTTPGIPDVVPLMNVCELYDNIAGADFSLRSVMQHELPITVGEDEVVDGIRKVHPGGRMRWNISNRRSANGIIDLM